MIFWLIPDDQFWEGWKLDYFTKAMWTSAVPPILATVKIILPAREVIQQTLAISFLVSTFQTQDTH